MFVCSHLIQRYSSDGIDRSFEVILQMLSLGMLNAARRKTHLTIIHEFLL